MRSQCRHEAGVVLQIGFTVYNERHNLFFGNLANLFVGGDDNMTAEVKTHSG